MSIESKALHAVMAGNLQEAQHWIDSLMPTECHKLAEQADKLGELAWQAYQRKQPVNPAGEEKQ